MITIYRQLTANVFYGSAVVAAVRRFSDNTTENGNLIHNTNYNHDDSIDGNSKKHFDEFMIDFLKNHIQLTTFQKILLTCGSSIAALLDPKRDDMLACLGETTGGYALMNILQEMKASDEGQLILKNKPRLNTRTIDMDRLKQLPENTFGRTYVKFLSDNQVTPDTRLPVHFINEPDLAYIMTRYRECHDFVHTMLDMPTNMLGEIAVKWFEALNNGLPVCYGAAIFGGLRLKARQREVYLRDYLPWAIENGKNAKPLMPIYWENYWDRDINELRNQLQIIPFNYKPKNK